MNSFAEFRVRPAIVHAARFNGTAEAAERISREIGPAICAPEFEAIGGEFTGNLIVHGANGSVLAVPGDWFVRDSDGEFGVYTDPLFRETFEPWTNAAKEMFAAEAAPD